MTDYQQQPYPPQGVQPQKQSVQFQEPAFKSGGVLFIFLSFVLIAFNILFFVHLDFRHTVLGIIEGKGEVTIEGNDSLPVTVFVDTNELGTIPITGEKILVGNHILKIEKANYQPRYYEFEIKKGDNLMIQLYLKEPLQRQQGEVVLILTPIVQINQRTPVTLKPTRTVLPQPTLIPTFIAENTINLTQ